MVIGELEVFVYLTLFTFVNSYVKKYKKNTKVPEKDLKNCLGDLWKKCGKLHSVSYCGFR
jgi:hypothetical protein